MLLIAACGALRRFATIFSHNLALSTTLYVSAKSCEHDLCAYVQGCLNCYLKIREPVYTEQTPLAKNYLFYFTMSYFKQEYTTFLSLG